MHEVLASELSELDFDVVILQRPEEVRLVEAWSGRRPGRDLRAVQRQSSTGWRPAWTRRPLAVIVLRHLNDGHVRRKRPSAVLPVGNSALWTVDSGREVVKAPSIAATA